jgi:hypothetical protein
MVPVGDLLGEAHLDRRLGLSDQGELAGLDLREVPGDDLGDGVALGLLLQLAADPLALGARQECVDPGLAVLERAVVEVGGVGEVGKEE